MKLVIVESPAKAQTINKYLGNNYKVVASIGHVRDLPRKDGAVEPEKDFQMSWDQPLDKKKVINGIIKDLKDAETLILATDPDREGEAISWHINEILNEKKALKSKQVQRVVFNEITKSSVLNAMEHPRDINSELVDAYLARRALDHLIGFRISPILWRKLPGSRSAGRVQSVALRLVCERELEIEKFIPEEYWSIKGMFNKIENEEFEARLIKFNDKKIEKLTIKNEKDALEKLALINKSSFYINKIEKKEFKRNPYPAFTTSSMQIESNRKLGLSASQTMRTAQKLYEGTEIEGEPTGLITYMRTDSVTMSTSAIDEIRSYVVKNLGKNYLSLEPRVYKSKAKNAQEAHECIRPTNVNLTPNKMKKYLNSDEFKLYEIIWQRAVSSQMASAIFDQMAFDINNDENKIVFRANGSSIKFKGMLAVYSDAKDDDKIDEENNNLPPLNEKDKLSLLKTEKKQHFTMPPPRYTEASLVKKLEELGIGRPSTYASIIKVLQDRNYVTLDKKRFIPHDRGRVVSIFLENYFNKYVEYDFTADLENQLDEISDGKLNWQEVIQKFWETFKDLCDVTVGKSNREIIDVIDNAIGPHFFPPDGSDDKRKCPTCDNGRLGLKVGKFGGFVGCSNYPECKYTTQFSQISESRNGKLIGPKEIGMYPETNEMITLRKGPYGFYMQVGEGNKEKKPKRVSIPKNFEPEEIGLNTAIQLLGLPRRLGKNPENDKVISVGIGMYGPYILHNQQYRALEKTDNILDINLERALELLKKPKAQFGNPILKTLGSHPDENKDITVHEGKFGPYVKCGKIMASLMGDQSIENIELGGAIELINNRKIKIKNKKKK